MSENIHDVADLEDDMFTRSMSSRDEVRNLIAQQVQDFLANGGTIEIIDAATTSMPSNTVYRRKSILQGNRASVNTNRRLSP